MWTNTRNGYGLITIVLHWLVAVVIVGLFALGLYMTGLTYYDPWYRTGPDIHKSVGILLFAVMLLRLAWRLVQPHPQAVPGTRPWEHLAAGLAHRLLYLLIFLVMISGYLISTAEGRGIEVFGWFTVPALVSDLPDQEDVAGDIHYWLAWGLIALAAFHALAAFKHALWDRDATLRRIVRPTRD